MLTFPSFGHIGAARWGFYHKLDTMEDSLLKKISKGLHQSYITNQWAIKKTGSIIDIQGDYVYRFVDYLECGDNIREKYHSDEEKLACCPIVASGIVGFWIRNHEQMNTRTLFESYFDWRYNQYEKAHENDEDAWERDLKEEFVKREHIIKEKSRIKTSEAVFEYLTEADKKHIQAISSSYLKFVRKKRRDLYPPHYEANKVIEDTFLSAYSLGGGAFQCLEWFRHKYDLPMMGPHWHQEGYKEPPLDKRWQEFYDRILPELVLEAFEDFDDGVLTYSDGGLINEIQNNLHACTSTEDRIIYLSSLLQPFKTFSEAFYAKGATDEREKAIEEDLKLIEYWETVPDDAVDQCTGEPIEPKKQIEACEYFVECYRKDIKYWEEMNSTFFDFAQRGLNHEFLSNDVPEMLTCLGRWWSLMITFSRRLAALALTYGIRLMDIQEQCAIYLTHSFLITDYVDDKFISTVEQAQKLLDKAFSINTNSPASKSDYDKVLEIVYGDYTELEHIIPDKNMLGEEDLRAHAVAALKTHGFSTTAESLNRNGKTDIKVQNDKGEVIFIAECKIWNGEKLFLEAVNQLFGYLNWHNTKAALIIFVENDSFKETIEKARKAIREHELYVKEGKYLLDKANIISCVCHHSPDKGFLIDLNIMLFHFPKSVY